MIKQFVIYVLLQERVNHVMKPIVKLVVTILDSFMLMEAINVLNAPD